MTSNDNDPKLRSGGCLGKAKCFWQMRPGKTQSGVTKQADRQPAHIKPDWVHHQQTVPANPALYSRRQ